MSRTLPTMLAALVMLMTACGGQNTATAPGASAGASPAARAAPAASPTPTAQVAKPAPPASPGPSPVAAASPAAAASPGVAASPVAAAASPVAAAKPAPVAAPTGGAVVYRVVPERSEAAYHARETFIDKIGLHDAVGRTKDVSGEIHLEQAGVLRGRVVNMRIDLRTLTSDSRRRDNFVRENTLETDRFPFAEFNSTEVVGPTSYAEGQEVSFQLPGQMKIRDQERPVVWDARATLNGSTITGTATTRIKLTDMGVQPPKLAVLTVEDEMGWEVRLTAERAP